MKGKLILAAILALAFLESGCVGLGASAYLATRRHHQGRETKAKAAKQERAIGIPPRPPGRPLDGKAPQERAFLRRIGKRKRQGPGD
jgi:hypothetical protein